MKKKVTNNIKDIPTNELYGCLERCEYFEFTSSNDSDTYIGAGTMRYPGYKKVEFINALNKAIKPVIKEYLKEVKRELMLRLKEE